MIVGIPAYGRVAGEQDRWKRACLCSIRADERKNLARPMVSPGPKLVPKLIDFRWLGTVDFCKEVYYLSENRWNNNEKP